MQVTRATSRSRQPTLSTTPAAFFALAALLALATLALAQIPGYTQEQLQELIQQAKNRDANGGIPPEQMEQIKRALAREEAAKKPKPAPKPRPPPPPPPPPLFELSDANYEELVANSTEVWLIAFVGDGCASCDAVKGLLQSIEPQMNGMARFGFAHASQSPSIFKALGVAGTPMLKLLGERMSNPHRAGRYYKRPIEYDTEAADPASILGFVRRVYPDLVVRVNATNEGTFLTAPHPQMPRLLVFSAKPEVSLASKYLAARFKGRAAVGFVHAAAEPALASTYGLDAEALASTAVLLVPGNSDAASAPSRAIRFEGSPTKDRLAEFLNEHALAQAVIERPPPPPPPKGKTKVPKTAAEEALENGFLTVATFDAQVITPERDALVEFYSSADASYSSDPTGAPLWAKLRGRLAHIVDVFSVDVATEPELAARFKVVLGAAGPAGFRSVIKAFMHDMKRTPVVVSEKRSLESLFQYAASLLPSYSVRLSPATAPSFFQMQMTKFKVLLATKTDSNPLFAALARDFRDHLFFAEIPHVATEILAAISKDLKEFPTLFVAGSIESEDAGLQFAHYHGPMEYRSMARYLEQFVRMQDERAGVSSGGRKGGKSEAAVDGKIAHAATAADMESMCTGRLGLCVLLVLDTVEAEDAQRYRGLLRALAGKHGDQGGLSFVWAGAHLSLIDGYRLGGVPSFVIIAGGKRRYAVHVGPIEVPALAASIADVKSGKKGTSPIAVWPQLPAVAVEEEADYDEEADRRAASEAKAAGGGGGWDDDDGDGDDDDDDDDESNPALAAALDAVRRAREL